MSNKKHYNPKDRVYTALWLEKGIRDSIDKHVAKSPRKTSVSEFIRTAILNELANPTRNALVSTDLDDIKKEAMKAAELLVLEKFDELSKAKESLEEADQILNKMDSFLEEDE